MAFDPTQTIIQIGSMAVIGLVGFGFTQAVLRRQNDTEEKIKNHDEKIQNHEVEFAERQGQVDTKLTEISKDIHYLTEKIETAITKMEDK